MIVVDPTNGRTKDSQSNAQVTVSKDAHIAITPKGWTWFTQDYGRPVSHGAFTTAEAAMADAKAYGCTIKTVDGGPYTEGGTH